MRNLFFLFSVVACDFSQGSGKFFLTLKSFNCHQPAKTATHRTGPSGVQ